MTPLPSLCASFIPWILFTGDLNRVTHSAEKLLTLATNCIRSWGEDGGAGVHTHKKQQAEITHDITKIMATEEYTHTMVTQDYTLSLKHRRKDEHHTTTFLINILSFLKLLCLTLNFWDDCWGKSEFAANIYPLITLKYDQCSSEMYTETSFSVKKSAFFALQKEQINPKWIKQLLNEAVFHGVMWGQSFSPVCASMPCDICWFFICQIQPSVRVYSSLLIPSLSLLFFSTISRSSVWAHRNQYAVKSVWFQAKSASPVIL